MQFHKHVHHNNKNVDIFSNDISDIFYLNFTIHIFKCSVHKIFYPWARNKTLLLYCLWTPREKGYKYGCGWEYWNRTVDVCLVVSSYRYLSSWLKPWSEKRNEHEPNNSLRNPHPNSFIPPTNSIHTFASTHIYFL